VNDYYTGILPVWSENEKERRKSPREPHRGSETEKVKIMHIPVRLWLHKGERGSQTA